MYITVISWHLGQIVEVFQSETLAGAKARITKVCSDETDIGQVYELTEGSEHPNLVCDQRDVQMEIEQLRDLYLEAYNEFMPLSELDEEGPLNKEQDQRYIELVEDELLPLSKRLEELGDVLFLDDHPFYYEL